MKAEQRFKFVCYWWFVGWHCWSLGVHFSTDPRNFELHLPFGFIRIGLERDHEAEGAVVIRAQGKRERGWSWAWR